MPTDDPHAAQHSTGNGPEAALARCHGPAWVIDPGRGRVLAANAAGAARLGLRPDAASGTLDAAMPGLVRLRAMVREPLDGGRREPLVFWTAYGAESLLCNVSALAEPSPSSLVLVTIVGADEDEAPPVDTTATNGAAAPADDAATLKKIARAIRSGFAGSKDDRTEPAEISNPEPAQITPAVPSEERKAQVSKLAHELRTPLSAIMAASEIMKDERFGTIANDRYRSYTVDIHDNARHALAVINRLLGEAAPEPATGELDSANLDLNAITEGSVSAMRPLAEKAKLSLSQELHSQLPHVIADAMSVKQILFNLLANAVKFTKPGGEVRVVTGLGFDQSIFVAIRDTGPGISPKEIARILDAKSPAKPEPKEAGGLGIGLPLALSLAAANGARLEIDSALGKGTAVALVFPEDRVVADQSESDT